MPNTTQTMTFKDIVMKLRRALLCCETDKSKHSLKIGSPTDVRRMDFSSIPVIKADDDDETHVYAPEKAPQDGIRLLSLQSHPPSQPPTSPPSLHSHCSSPTQHAQPSLPSREPSQTLLNAASANLPKSLPTPPRQRHDESSPPSSRMKSMWEKTRRLSNACSLGSSHAEYQILGTSSNNNTDNTTTTINNDTNPTSDHQTHLPTAPSPLPRSPSNQKLRTRDSPIIHHETTTLDASTTPRSVSKSSVIEEGFEEQDTVGGYEYDEGKTDATHVQKQKKKNRKGGLGMGIGIVMGGSRGSDGRDGRDGGISSTREKESEKNGFVDGRI